VGLDVADGAIQVGAAGQPALSHHYVVKLRVLTRTGLTEYFSGATGTVPAISPSASTVPGDIGARPSLSGLQRRWRVGRYRPQLGCPRQFSIISLLPFKLL
jgi:hypothetical protein